MMSLASAICYPAGGGHVAVLLGQDNLHTTPRKHHSSGVGHSTVGKPKWDICRPKWTSMVQSSLSIAQSGSEEGSF